MTSSSIEFNEDKATSNVDKSSNAIQFTIEQDVSVNNNKATKLSSEEVTFYYFQEPLSSGTILSDQDDHSLWKLMNKDWNGFTLIYQDLTVNLSTIAPQFKFNFKQQEYHWQLVPTNDCNDYNVYCYRDNTSLIAEFKNNQLFILDRNDTILTSLLCLSGLLVSQILQSLGDKYQVTQMILTNQNYTYSYKPQMSTTDEDDDQENEISSLTSIITKNNHNRYQYLIHSLDNNSRLSLQSFKSIELNPGIFRCYWGYNFWWSWLPCCMPGGVFDKFLIKLKGGYKLESSIRSLSHQGYQQQRY